MFCEKCGNQIPDGAEFCPNCGMKITVEPSGVKTPFFKSWKFWVVFASTAVVAVVSTVIIILVLSNKNDAKSVPMVKNVEQQRTSDEKKNEPNATEEPAQQVNEEQVAQFKEFFENNVEEELGLLPNNLKGTFGSADYEELYKEDEDVFDDALRSTLTWNGTEAGIITADILDLDSDGNMEMIVFFTKESDAYDNYYYMSGAVNYYYRIYVIHNQTPVMITEKPIEIDYSAQGDMKTGAPIVDEDYDGTSWKSKVEIFKKKIDNKQYFIFHIEAAYDNALSDERIDTYGYTFGSCTTDMTGIQKNACAVLSYKDGELVQSKAESEMYLTWHDSHTSTGDYAFDEDYSIEGTGDDGKINSLYCMKKRFASEHKLSIMTNKQAKKAKNAPKKFKKDLLSLQKSTKDRYWSDFGFKWMEGKGENCYYDFGAELIGSSEIVCKDWLSAENSFSLKYDEESAIIADVNWNIVDHSFTQEMR
ncbi:MAG: zinc ribbon domain-containing protein [Eubacterium sp.]|nr:zinc ribbon domain-containing protein [Eubacterium sp.]